MLRMTTYVGLDGDSRGNRLAGNVSPPSTGDRRVATTPFVTAVGRDEDDLTDPNVILCHEQIFAPIVVVRPLLLGSSREQEVRLLISVGSRCVEQTLDVVSAVHLDICCVHGLCQVEHRIANRITAVRQLLYVEDGTFLDQKLSNHQPQLVGKRPGPAARQLQVLGQSLLDIAGSSLLFMGRCGKGVLGSGEECWSNCIRSEFVAARVEAHGRLGTELAGVTET